ncbi:3'-5' exonuclease [Taibaiella sp. KBW10]|uniref:3'-5' exonuclease n=1 Tax=Taibaiella sp. KBW10 TaxID=2153357 RepID=UPI0018F61302|nr:3'-5' exonuclease [Taibaiella sp. KBW10]
MSQLSQILVIDIETVSMYAEYTALNEAMQAHWQRKAAFLKLSEAEANDSALSYENRAGIYAEFGKIVCIGLGFIDQDHKTIRIKSLQNDDEAALLQEFIALVDKIALKNKELLFCGHNIKEFDLPYICRRCAIHQIPLPASLQLSGLKPWQIHHIDTLELWRFGDHKHYTALDLLAQILKVPSSKTEMDGSEVGHAYWKEHKLEDIARYCRNDIFTTALVYLRLLNQDINSFTPSYVV